MEAFLAILHFGVNGFFRIIKKLLDKESITNTIIAFFTLKWVVKK